MMVGRHLRRTLSAVAVAVACVGLCAPSALADDGVDWRIEDMGVRGAWSAGITGKGVTVAVIDTQVVADHPSLQGADVEYRLALETGTSCQDEYDSSRVMHKPGDVTLSTSDGFYNTHGTVMVSLIAGNGKGYDDGIGYQGIAPDAHVIAYPHSFTKAGPTSGIFALGHHCVAEDGQYADLPETSLADAVDSGARVVNMSYGDFGFNDSHGPVALHAIRHGVILVSGRNNDIDPGLYDLVGNPLSTNYFPGTVTTNSIGRDGSISKVSDTMDGNVSILSPGVGIPAAGQTDSKETIFAEGGTSSATADLTGYLALVLQKWPDATGNQVLQSLVRNTKGNDSGEAKLDPEHKRGFGEVDLEKLLRMDPTAYPDINPLLEWAVKASEEHEETKGLYTRFHDMWKEGGAFDTDPFSPEGKKIECSYLCRLIGKEAQREKKAWKKVEQCRKDGGSDCMKYSATATADKADREGGWDDVKAEYGRPSSKPPKSDESDEADESDGSLLPPWFVPAVIGGPAVLTAALFGGIALAVTHVRRKRRRAAGTGATPAANGYYVAAGPTPTGPLDTGQLASMAADGTLTGTTPVWRQGMDGWHPAATIAELVPILQTVGTPTAGNPSATMPQAGAPPVSSHPESTPQAR